MCVAPSVAVAIHTACVSASLWVASNHGHTTTEDVGKCAVSSCHAVGGWLASWASSKRCHGGRTYNESWFPTHKLRNERHIAQKKKHTIYYECDKVLDTGCIQYPSLLLKYVSISGEQYEGKRLVLVSKNTSNVHLKE